MADKGKSFESSFDGDGKSNHDKLGDSSSGVVVSDDFEKDFNVNTSAFEVLERDFQDVVSELMGESSLEKFRLEYEKLHRALRKSHEQEKRLVKKCRELNSEILNNQAKIKTALRLSQEDQKTIAHLQREMEKTWKLVYTSQEKEARATETISTLKDEMLNLAALVEKGALVGSDQEVLVTELKHMNEELNHQVTKQAHVVQEYDHTIQHLTKINQELLKEKELAVNNIDSLAEELDAQEKELIKVTKKRDKLIKEFESASTTLEDNKRVIDKLTEDTRLSKSQNTELSFQLKESKAVIQKHLKEYEALFAKSSKVTEDLEAQIQKNKEKRAECINLENELKYANQEVGRLSSEKTLWERKYEKEARDVSHYKEMAESSKIPLVLAKQEIETLKNDILLLHREENELMKKNEFIAREKEKQMQQTERAEGKIKENLNMIQQHTRIENNLIQEMNTYKEEITNLKKTIGSLERDREKLSQEISNQRNNYLSSEEEIKMRDMQINELNLKINDSESKLKYQLQLYETLRYDRNNISKSLAEITEESHEMKKNIKIYLQQISQLKDELSIKEQIIAKEQYETSKLEKVKESLQLELQRKNILFSTDHELVDHHELEIKKLSNLIKKVDGELYDQKIAYDHLINERDVIGLQLIRRNDEIALLMEKIRVQESALKSGENQYNERLNDIQLLKAKIRDITREYNLTKNSGIKITDMKRNILQLEKDLLQERTRVTALSEELENPMNIHRWRKLEGSDPATYELILKVQMLQKKLILKSEEVVEKGILLNEKDQLYLELQDVLKRQPGPEVGEQITTYQRNLKTKNTQMKVMISELNMYQAQSHEYKYEMERLSREVQDLKRKYFQQKRADETSSSSSSSSLQQQQQYLQGAVSYQNSNNNNQNNQDSYDNFYTDSNINNNNYSNNNTSSASMFSRSSPVKLGSAASTGAVFSAGGSANAVMMAGGVRSSGKVSVAGGGFVIKQPAVVSSSQR